MGRGVYILETMTQTPHRDPSPAALLAGAPRPVLILTLAGLLPFFGSALILAAAERSSAQLFGYFSLIGYSAAILSFLGGARWGQELAQHRQDSRWTVMGAAVIPALTGWLSVPLAGFPRISLVALILAFAAVLVWDLWAIAHKSLPQWYAPLRIIASAGAMIALIASLYTLDPGTFG